MDTYLEKRGQARFSVSQRSAEVDLSDWKAGVRAIEEKYHLTSLRTLTNHQRIALHAANEEALLKTAYRYFLALERFFRETEIRHAVHEIGGWLGNRVLELVSQAHGCDNVYIEPSMFRGRVILFKNSFMPVIPKIFQPGELTEEERNRSEEFIHASLSASTVIMPFKDVDKYKDVGLGFTVNLSRVRDAAKGVRRRYFVNKGEELVAPLRYIALGYLKRSVRRKFLAPLCARPVPGERYFYYPLHMPIDMQILVRSPQFFDQYSLIEYIARMLPQGSLLYFKEHPVSIGMYDYFQMRRLAKIPNVRMIDPRVNSHELIRNAQAIVTVNSKVGFEALYHQKPVITLGGSFYRNRGLTMDVDELAGIDQAFRESESFRPDRERLLAFIHSLYRCSYSGELYQNTDGNHGEFSRSVLEFLNDPRV
jgi:hypothetical protein